MSLDGDAGLGRGGIGPGMIRKTWYRRVNARVNAQKLGLDSLPLNNECDNATRIDM